jgi:NTE family protein
LRGLDFNKFMDDSWGVVRDTDRLINEFGWYKGDYFRDWIAGVIRDKVGNSEATFSDLKGKGCRDLYFIGTNLSTKFSEVFSAEHTPRMVVADAVRISMSIPLFFAAKRSFREDVYVDGGVLDNYPVKLFDREKYIESNSTTPKYYEEHNNRLAADGIEVSKYVFNQETLGFRLDSVKEIAVFRDHAEPSHEAVKDFFDYAKALIGTVMDSQDSLHLHSDDWQRTIYIDSIGVKTTDFNLSDKTKQDLVDSGTAGVETYFKWYDNQANQPANRP